MHSMRIEGHLAEAAKLRKPPAIMSDRELVELFMSGLSMQMVQTVFQYLLDDLSGNLKKNLVTVRLRLNAGPKIAMIFII